jgi:RNA polymerase sigma-70 factor (ECF subfamily)
MSPDRQWQPERYRPVLSVLARQMQLNPRLRRRFDSSDLVQITMLRAHEGLGEFRGASEGELVAWLQRILTNVAIDVIRRETAQQRDPALEEYLHSAAAESSARLEGYLASKEAAPDSRVARHEVLVRIAAAIDGLPEDQRDVVIGRDLLGNPVADIAEQLGRSEKSVAGLLLRGRQALREALPDLQVR